MRGMVLKLIILSPSFLNVRYPAKRPLRRKKESTDTNAFAIGMKLKRWITSNAFFMLSKNEDKIRSDKSNLDWLITHYSLLSSF